jgi:hypothetical protein
MKTADLLSHDCCLPTALCAKHIHDLQRSDTLGNAFVCGLCSFSRREEVYIRPPPTAPAPGWLEQPQNSFSIDLFNPHGFHPVLALLSVCAYFSLV